MKFTRVTSKIFFVLLLGIFVWLTVSFASHHDLGGGLNSVSPDTKEWSPDGGKDQSSIMDQIIQQFKDDMQQSDPRLDELFDHFDDPFKEMEDIRKKMEERLKQFHTPLDEQFNRRLDHGFDRSVDVGKDARMDIHEDDDWITCVIDVGKVNPRDLHVDISRNVVTVSGNVNATETSEKNGVKSTQNYVVKFYRTFPVPKGVVVDKADVQVAVGKIVVKFPKGRN